MRTLLSIFERRYRAKLKKKKRFPIFLHLIRVKRVTFVRNDTLLRYYKTRLKMIIFGFQP